MAEDNLAAMAVSFLLIGIVIFGGLSFFISLANNEGRGEILEEFPEIENLRNNYSNVYTSGQLIETVNINSNLSANYNPELAISGADQSGNAIQTNLQNIVTSVLVLGNVLVFVLFGNIVGQIIFGLITTAVGIYASYYFIKNIRQGI